MDIERLKELKDYLRVANELSILNDDNLMQRIVDNNDVTNTIDIAIELLNAEIARQSVKSEDVQEAIEQVEGTRRRAQKELDSLTEIRSRYDHQIEIGDPWNWKWEESWHPSAVKEHKQTIKNANLVIAALQAYQPTIRKNRTVEEVAISKTETTSEPCSECRLYQRFVLGDGVK